MKSICIDLIISISRVGMNSVHVIIFSLFERYMVG